MPCCSGVIMAFVVLVNSSEVEMVESEDMSKIPFTKRAFSLEKTLPNKSLYSRLIKSLLDQQYDCKLYINTTDHWLIMQLAKNRQKKDPANLIGRVSKCNYQKRCWVRRLHQLSSRRSTEPLAAMPMRSCKLLRSA